MIENGAPVYEDRALFECLCLEGQQAGLSWITIRKAARYRTCFKHFEIGRVARMQDRTLERLLLDRGLVRNRLKLYAIRSNARACQQQEEFGSFSAIGLSSAAVRWMASVETGKASPPLQPSVMRCPSTSSAGVYIRGQHNLLRSCRRQA